MPQASVEDTTSPWSSMPEHGPHDSRTSRRVLRPYLTADMSSSSRICLDSPRNVASCLSFACPIAFVFICSRTQRSDVETKHRPNQVLPCVLGVAKKESKFSRCKAAQPASCLRRMRGLVRLCLCFFVGLKHAFRVVVRLSRMKVVWLSLLDTPQTFRYFFSCGSSRREYVASFRCVSGLAAWRT